jgi:hypothetical protein
LSAFLAIEHRVLVTPTKLKAVKAFSRARVLIIGECIMEVLLKDDHDIARLYTLCANVAEQKDYPTILGRPYLGIVPLDID